MSKSPDPATHHPNDPSLQVVTYGWLEISSELAQVPSCPSVSCQAPGWSQPAWALLWALLWVLLWVFILMTTATIPNSHSSTSPVDRMCLRINAMSWSSTLNMQRLLHKGPDASLGGLGASLYHILLREPALNTLPGGEWTKHFCFPGQQVLGHIPHSHL